MNESKEEEEEEEEGILPRPPAAATNNIVPALPQVQCRSADSGGDDYEKAPPRRFSMSPPVNEIAVTSIAIKAAATLALLGPAEPQSKMAVSQIATADLPQVASPSQKNRRKGEGGSGKMLRNRVHRRINWRQDEEIVSTDDHDNLTNPEDDDVSSSMRPGAFAVGGIATRSGRSSTPPTSTGEVIGDSVLVTDHGTPSEPQIVAFLAPEHDEQQVETRIAQTAKERLRRRMEEGEVILANEVKDDDSSSYCGMKKRTLLLLGVLTLLLMIVGGVVGGVLSSKAADVLVVPTPAPTMLGDVLVDELMLLNATLEKDIWRFSRDPESPQYQALEWMKNDTIVMSPGRSTLDLLQRYVLAVLFYSTNGQNWGWSNPYLSSDDVCSWNNGTNDHGYGVYCRLDGKSVDELVLSDNSLRGHLPWALWLLTKLETINLVDNEFTGTVPTELGQVLSLQSLHIGSNQLRGTIPTELGQLVSLESLDMWGNQLTGTIPTELGQLTSLPDLVIFYNQLTGTMPTELGHLLSLTSLDMWDNQLTGTIPTELGQLVSLTSLDISFNQLTGTIPTELGQLVSLESLAMYYNQLTGSLEQSFCVENRTWDLLKVDCDKVECSCCECA